MQHPSTRSFHGEALEPRLLLSSGYTLAADTSFIPEPEGIDPTALVVDQSGNLFGATTKGGAGNDGTVFEIPSGTTTIETLASFDNSVLPIGTVPSSLTLGANGDVFCLATSRDGTGTVFEVRAGSGEATRVAGLSRGGVGYAPAGPLIYYDGNLYGAGTEQGEINGQTFVQGVVFELNLTTDATTDLATFGTSSRYDPALGLTLAPGGNLVGETNITLSGDPASVFDYSIGSGTLTTRASFGADERVDGGLTLDSAGDIFGTTVSISTGWGDRVFEILPGTRAIQTVASFSGSQGSGIRGPLTLDMTGDLYGSTDFGGANDSSASIFEVPRGANTVTTIASFNRAKDGVPGGTMALGPNGDLFDTTAGGGTDNQGTVFRLAGNVIVTVANFTDTSPSQPSGALVSDPEGNLFGTTSAGGANHDGTLFEVPQGSSAITVIASFDTNVQKPSGNLVMDSSGDLFGTATGSVGYGTSTVFELPHGSTTITALATVPRLEPWLALDANGNLFGVIGESTIRTASGKIVPRLPASVFEIPHGTSTLSTFARFGRGVAPGAVSLDPAGDIFGTFSSPRAQDSTIYDIAHGTHTINPLSKLTPYGTPGPLTIDTAGNLFGTITGVSAVSAAAAVFELPHGARQVEPIAYLRGFDNVEALEPLVIDANGNIFGAISGSNPEGSNTRARCSKSPKAAPW